jgi:hypothetical protein
MLASFERATGMFPLRSMPNRIYGNALSVDAIQHNIRSAADD